MTQKRNKKLKEIKEVNMFLVNSYILSVIRLNYQL